MLRMRLVHGAMLTAGAKETCPLNIDLKYSTL